MRVASWQRGDRAQPETVAHAAGIDEAVGDFRQQRVTQYGTGCDPVLDRRLTQARAAGNPVGFDNATLDVVALGVLDVQCTGWGAAPKLHDVSSDLTLSVASPAGSGDREAEMVGARVQRDVRADLASVHFDAGARSLVQDVSSDGRVLEKAAGRISEVPRMDTGALFGMGVVGQVRSRGTRYPLQRQPADVPLSRIDSNACVGGIRHGEACPGEGARHRVDEDAAAAARVGDRPTPKAPAAGVLDVYSRNA